MPRKEIPELTELLQTVARATADGRMLWEIVGYSLYPAAVSFLCKTNWCHFKCWYEPADGRHHMSIFGMMEIEVAGADPEFVTADLDSASYPLVGILHRCLMDRFEVELKARFPRMRRAVADFNRKLVEALACGKKGDKL